MNLSEILSKVDHTQLGTTATEQDIVTLCDDAIRFGTATVCIPPSYVAFAKQRYGENLKICTVIGFPNGYNTTSVKCFETEQAVKDGADEIDMVINIGWLKDKKYDSILDEINRIKKSCGGKLLKVIIETCQLTDDEKIKMCEIVSNSNADYIKTSTGFSNGGATFQDIALFSENVINKKIKAAGGISSIADAERFIELGADRLGTSRIVKIVKEKENGREVISDTTY
ncbi:MAG: deoxyribose-phosphate aldolase [Clostridia bacterium]|nr:deoxyribose-phosphate aldolase [Clostridia bacterium]